jgi:exosortase D (VPLPA-CTERM-specific)
VNAPIDIQARIAPARSLLAGSGWIVFGVLSGLLVVLAYPSLRTMVVNEWLGTAEYSHGALIPIIAAWLVRQRATVFEAEGAGHVLGVAVVALGVALVLIGGLSTIHVVAQYGFVIGIFGAIGATFGGNVLRRLVLPLAVLFFMVPLPNFFYQPLSSQLQLLSSEIGVAIIRLFGISVLLEGNVIDLGAYQLEVAEACNGLRYLFPLASLGYLFGYLYRGPAWQRVLLFAASVPITIALNSVRIAVIGLTVDLWGAEAAEGFLHDFEGWAVFMVCVAILLAFARVLATTSGRTGPLLAQFDTELPDASAAFRRPTPGSAVAVLVCAATIALGGALARGPLEIEHVALPARQAFAEFPADLGDAWLGHRDVLDEVYLESLALDDYLLADYVNRAGDRVNLYSAFYATQIAGKSAHSPRSCMPGGGWEITSLTTIELPDPLTARPVPVSRAVIQRGTERQLVYYWFEQRGRVIADEYQVKWYLLVDALRTGRSDGALVRLVTPVTAAGGLEHADRTLVEFFGRAKARLASFVPE